MKYVNWYAPFLYLSKWQLFDPLSSLLTKLFSIPCHYDWNAHREKCQYHILPIKGALPNKGAPIVQRKPIL